jgi:HEPN domain-containing protein
MTTRNQLKELALLRLREAQALFEAGLYDGAKYLAGYVVEFALKARICRILDVGEYPSTGELGRVYATHDLDRLLTLSGLRQKLGLSNKAVFDNWSVATPWRPEQRYDAPGTVTKRDAEDILNAIRDKQHGVLTWIKKFW